MFSIPPLPSWDGLHPIIIHFPIAGIVVVPVLILLALFWRKHTGILLIVSTLLLVLAAGAACIATSTGEAAADLVAETSAHQTLLEEHEELAEAARNFTLALASVLSLATIAFWKWESRIPRGIVTGSGFLFIIANCAGILVVANTAHLGGKLVHEAGIHARLSAGPNTSRAAPSSVPSPRIIDDNDD